MAIHTKNDFSKLVEQIQNSSYYRKPLGFGIARVDLGVINPFQVLQATFPFINWQENYGSAAVFLKALQKDYPNTDFFETSEEVFTVSRNFITEAYNYFAPWIEEAMGYAHKNVQVIKYLRDLPDEELGNYRVVFLFEDTAPQSVEAVYLKLYALSLKKAKLRSLNLNGAFGILPNVAWVGNMPIELDWLRENEIELKLKGEYPNIDSVDKFPRYLHHIIPADNTRILDATKVRMGAQLAPGTTVMPGASYINFNAGTEGPVMVEGRISSSAIVGAGSDVGGGASILGVLSGTNGNPISIGENCLLGANSVTGIPLGDGCIVDAGVTILPGTKIAISHEESLKIAKVNPNWVLHKEEGDLEIDYDEDNNEIYIIKGKYLQGLNGLHFRQNSTTGQIIAMRSTREVKLNKELH